VTALVLGAATLAVRWMFAAGTDQEMIVRANILAALAGGLLPILLPLGAIFSRATRHTPPPTAPTAARRNGPDWREAEDRRVNRVKEAIRAAHPNATVTAGEFPGEPERATQRSQRRIRVFLCHAAEDKQFTRELCERLLAAGYDDVWFDERSLLPGQAVRYEISAAVKNSDAVIVVLSHHSVDKVGYVQYEVQQALEAAAERPEGAIFIIPLLLHDVPVPSRLAKWVSLDASSPDWFDRLLRSLHAVETAVESSSSRLRPEQPSSQAPQASGETRTDLEGFWEENKG
jgi:hypothetical protein